MNNARFLVILILYLFLGPFATAQYRDFSNAVIYTPELGDHELQKAAQVFRQVVKEHTTLQLPLIHKTSFEKKGRPVIMILTRRQVQLLPESYTGQLDLLLSTGKDGYKIIFFRKDNKVAIVGHDSRGALYGVGWLLRKAQLRPEKILIPGTINISSTPAAPIRGHQLGYRPKTNAYDAWTVSQFDHYIRNLALFGANSIEIMPPRTDDDLTSPLMKLPPVKMMVQQARIAKSYGLDVWMWYPNMGSNYTSPDSIAKELKERDSIFRLLPELDAVFVPAGDPGHLQPDVLFQWLKKVADVLHKYHPDAKIWVSPQVTQPTPKWYDAFYEQVNKGYSWLGGVVYGPWVAQSIKQVRRSVRKDLPLLRYPDITHNYSSQYPVPRWDLAYAMTLGRESYNPRPIAEKHIQNLFARYAVGSICYSEGINDDVNKFVWLGQEWDPHTPAVETLRDYARLFISPDYADPVARGLMALEDNFEGPLLVNKGVDLTLQQWQDMEKDASPDIRGNFRFQMGLLRAYYDAYVRRRLIYETNLEQRAREILAMADSLGANKAVDSARRILLRAKLYPVRPDWRQRCFALADSLFENIGSQTSVKRYGAKRGRGDFMDHIDAPLNNSGWLLSRFSKIKEKKSELRKLTAIQALLHRTDPGPGGFYDNFGSYGSWKRIVYPKTWAEDPGNVYSPVIDFGVSLTDVNKDTVPLAWRSQITTHYQTPLMIKYDHLDPKGAYDIRISYTGRFHSKMKLVADNQFIIHDFIQTGGRKAVYEFPVPGAAVSDGSVIFSWTCAKEGRGAQVAEIWLIKK